MTLQIKKVLRNLTSYFTKSLTAKIILSSVIISVVPLVISSFFSYNNSIRVLQEQYINSSETIVQQGSQNISNYFEQLNQITLSIYKDDEFIRDLLPESNDFLPNSYNEKFLKSILFSRNEFEYLYYYVPASKTLYSFSKQMPAKNIYPEIENEQWYKNTLKSRNGLYIEPVHKFKNYNKIGILNNENVMTFHRTVKEVSSGEILGTLSLSISSNTLAGFCKTMQKEGEVIFLIDNDNKIFYSTSNDSELINQLSGKAKSMKLGGYYSVRAGKKEYSVIYSKTFNNLLLFKAIPNSLLQYSARKSIETNYIILIITLIVIITISIASSITISLPIKHLVKNMKKLGEGKFDVYIENNRSDEIGMLSDKFNTMAREINQLVNSEFKAKIAKKNAQLRALQAQINPHFMNNALQSLGTLALRRNAPEIYEMAKAIASMLRYSIRFSNEMVSLETEIENTNYYLYIQKVRFQNSLEVIYNIDESVMQCPVPRLILQPIVENSIKYGIERDNIKEKICINVVKDGDNIILTVMDNGLGMEENKAREIQNWLEEDDDPLSMGEHTGIKNVSNRIKLIYNKDAEIKFYSRLNEGTTVSITIPIKVERDEHDV